MDELTTAVDALRSKLAELQQVLAERLALRMKVNQELRKIDGEINGN